MKILVIRRDNIGDLVCTTPILSQLRLSFPGAYIYALVNSYNAPVLQNNHNIDETYTYKKTKHIDNGESKISVWLSTLKLLFQLRKKKMDYAIIASSTYSKSAIMFAHIIKARRIIAFAPNITNISDPINIQLTHGLHETEAIFQLLIPLGIDAKPGPVEVFPQNQYSTLSYKNNVDQDLLIGLHISARKPKQRWPIEYFSELAHRLNDTYTATFLLFWSPGSMNHSQHPGDDEKAEEVQLLCSDIPLTPFPTQNLTDLINGLSLCDYLICSDGGGMHLAAGLNKPIICLFGNSNAEQWHPWGVPYELLQKESEVVEDISVEEVLSANSSLLKKTNIHKT